MKNKKLYLVVARNYRYEDLPSYVVLSFTGDKNFALQQTIDLGYEPMKVLIKNSFKESKLFTAYSTFRNDDLIECVI